MTNISNLFLIDVHPVTELKKLGLVEQKLSREGFDYRTIPCEGDLLTIVIASGKVELGKGLVPSSEGSVLLSNLDPELIFGRASFDALISELKIDTDYFRGDHQVWREIVDLSIAPKMER